MTAFQTLPVALERPCVLLPSGCAPRDGYAFRLVARTLHEPHECLVGRWNGDQFEVMTEGGHYRPLASFLVEGWVL